MTDGLISDAHVKAGVPMQREGSPDDIAGLTLFLASRVSSVRCLDTRILITVRKAGAYVNGTVHLIDGGRLTLFPSTY